VKNNDIDAAIFHSHTLKGMAANVSARRLSYAAYQIELCAKQGGADALYPFAEKLEREFERFQAALSEMFPDIFKKSAATARDETDETSEVKKNDHQIQESGKNKRNRTGFAAFDNYHRSQQLE
jgi:HPt (histidine-containing phosphotransfer) domain-containing protein